jgi:hypothetical protein
MVRRLLQLRQDEVGCSVGACLQRQGADAAGPIALAFDSTTICFGDQGPRGSISEQRAASEPQHYPTIGRGQSRDERRGTAPGHIALVSQAAARPICCDAAR